MIKMIFGKALAVTVLMLFAGINLIPLIESTSFQNSQTSDSSHYSITDGYYTKYHENLRGKPDGLAPKTVRTQKVPQTHDSFNNRGYFYAYNIYDPSGGHVSGPITFDTPDAIELLAPGINPNFIAGADIDDFGNWYGVDYAGGIYLTEFDGTMTFIASCMGFNGITFDATTGIWYACTSSDLYILDIVNGTATLVGNFGINTSMIDIACNLYGYMYGYDVKWAGYSILYSINKETGAATVIGSMGYGFVYSQDCEFDRDNDILYIAGYFNDGSPSALLTCDVTTGQCIFIGSFEGGMEIDGLAIPWTSIQYTHDIGITSVLKPFTGNAAPITPVVKIKNSGNFTETNVNIQLEIGKELITGTLEDFESTNGSYTHFPKTIDAWEYGVPTSGPMAAHSGSNLWATILGGNYPNSMWSGLKTQPFVVPSGAGFSFWHWYNFEDNWDGGNVKISTDGGTTYTLITPIGSYPGFLDYNPYMPGQAAYTGNGNGWKKAEFDLSAYEGMSVIILWETASDSSATYPGWYLDDVGFTITSWVNVYDQTVNIPSIAPSESIEVAFPEWTPADLGLVENTNINYFAEATNLFADQNTNNDYKAKPFTLHFGWFNDMKVNAINSPESGLAAPQIPEVAIENVGQFDASANVNMAISRIQYGAQWTQEADGEWQQTFSSVAGGMSPEAYLPYSVIQGDYAYLMSCPIDTTAESTLSLSFRSMINNYAGGYNCYIKTRSSESDPWTDVSPWSNPIYVNISAAQYTIDISGDIGTDTQVMFEFDGYYYNLNYWYVDDFVCGAYSTDFSGTFPPFEMTLIPEYDGTTTVDVVAGETVNVSLPEWTPADLPFATAIDYLLDASISMNVSDGNPSDNELTKFITLSYEHDVGVIEITQPDRLYYLWDYPVEGIIQNFGVTYSELDIPVNAQFEVDDVVIYDETVIVQGPLFPGATTIVIFPNITMPRTLPRTDLKLTMQTQLVNDDHPENNKKIKTWYIPPPPDVTPPVTNATVSGNVGQNGWYVSNVQVTLIAVDFGGELPMGVNNTYYSINDPDPTTWELYTTPIVVDDYCFHGKVYFYSDDKEIPPNVEEVKNVSFKIDQDPPIFTDYTFTPVNFMKDEWLCKATGVDSCSGIVLVEFYVDGTLIGNVTGEPYEFEFDGKPTNNSQALAYDAAGNSALSPIAQYYEMNYQTRQSHQIFGEENKNEI